jgi:ribosomal protein S18 acetylase RimI-like enzyme
MNNKNNAIDIRQAVIADGPAVVALDAEITGTDKSGYWDDILQLFTGASPRIQRHFLVATGTNDELLGYVVGEIRAWEFGSPPCGWVLDLGVSPQHRERGIGSLLLDALAVEMKTAGIATIRTMVLRTDKVNLSFFRGEGLAAGPYIELEKRLD